MKILAMGPRINGNTTFIIEGVSVPVIKDAVLGSPRVGSNLQKVEGGYMVIDNTVDPDCVGGACGTGGNA